MAARFALLPNARSELTARAVVPASGGQRRRLTLDLEITADDIAQPPRIPVSGELFGPGDIVAISRAMISRVEPAGGLRGFEPNYMPFVEFVDADFPWRYSLDSGDPARIKPWIVLIVLTADEFEYLDGATALPRIRVSNPSRSLPDLDQSWALAHVQVALPQPADTIAGSMPDPARHFSRLLCPRRLAERQSYSLFLVPAYDAGRLTGTASKEAPATFDAPSWMASSATPVDLPVYFQSRFVTDSLEDVETLIRRLRPLTSDEVAALGTPRRASAAQPGYYPNYERPGAGYDIQGALRRPDAPEPGIDTDPALTDLMTATLGEVIAGDADAEDPDGDDPLVAFPAYGWRYRQATSVSRVAAEQQAWFDLINLDLKFREAAGLGAETVRRNQEQFAKRCWDQYQEVIDTNRGLARLKAASVLVRHIVDRHLAKLPADTALTLAEPLQPYVKSAGGPVVVDDLRQHGAPSSFATRALRRVSAKRPVAVEVAGRGRIRAFPVPAIPGDTTSDPIARNLQRPPPARVNDPLIARQGFAVPIARGVAGFLAADKFADVLRARRVGIRIKSFQSSAWSARLSDTLKALPRAKADFTVAGRAPAETTDIRPVYRSPVIEEPLSSRMLEFAAGSILTDASRIPSDTVAMCAENRRFIEAFMVGANHEMNKELRWREFPTDLRGTIFRRFWDRGRAVDDPSGDDIADIHTWNARLGSHSAPGLGGASADFVIVIRSDVVRKLDMPIVVLNEAVGPQWQSGSGINHEPAFFGKIGSDIAYYGFEVPREHILGTARDRAFLLIYEPAGRLRFGLDVANTTVRQQREDVWTQSLAFPVRALGRTELRVKLRKNPPGPIPPVPARWDDFSWRHVALTDAAYVNFATVMTIPGQPDLWGTGKTAASVARSFWQKPLVAVVPLRRIV
ncbi:MAG TPA: hypothetical protein VGJ08_13220 [Rhizomicrobium sp.]